MFRCHSLMTCLGLIILAGCSTPFHDARQLETTQRLEGPYFQPYATSIEYPDVDSILSDELSEAPAPRTLENPDELTPRPLGLEEAIRMALSSSDIIRTLGGTVVQAPGATTVYDIGLTESDPGASVEAALSAFDARWTSNLNFTHSERPVNQPIAGLVLPPFQQKGSTFVGELAKTTATGSRFAVRHHVTYANTNRIPSDYKIDYEAEWRQPLLQGAGLQFNRIAGPNGQAGSSSGVLIARLNTDVALADFESAVINLVADVERGYWDLYFSYHDLESRLAARRSALTTWRNIAERARLGLRGGEAENEAQARAQFFTLEAAVQDALSGPTGLYAREEQLRLVLGLPPNDGVILRPNVEPILAEVIFEWNDLLDEAIYRRVELRGQKWIIKRRELELVASQNHLLPTLDAVGLYRWFGLGDDLIGRRGPGGAANAYQNLTGGDFQEWQMGFEFSFPVGYRQAALAVRNAELRLGRENAVLQEQQLRVSHELSSGIRNVRRTHQLIKTNFNRRVASQYEVEAIQALFDAGRIGIDVLLQSQQRQAEANSAYFRAVADYNLAVSSIHQSKGSLLEYDRVQLAEGPWTAPAHDDAHRRSRGFGLRNHPISTPNPISRGDLAQDRQGLGPASEWGPTQEPAQQPTQGPAQGQEPAQGQQPARGREPGQEPAQGQTQEPERGLKPVQESIPAEELGPVQAAQPPVDSPPNRGPSN